MNMHSIVIIGAGQTGRGYLNRFFYLAGKKVTFIDENKDLVQKLQEQKRYEIRFGSNGRKALQVDNFDAYAIDSEEAKQALMNAELVFISIGANRLAKLMPYLQSTLAKRLHRDVDVITAENGVHPASVLQSLSVDKGIHLSESIVFCTTIEDQGTLDIISEDLDHLPYDVNALGHTLAYEGMIAEKKFKELLERKIYTYNCISACVAYLGYRKGYEKYAEAANNEEIASSIEQIANVINQSIAKEYNMAIEEQTAFSRMAIDKFKNKNIVDTIERNVRDVKRKLGEKERIVAPLVMMQKHGMMSEELLYVAACAVQYGKETNTLMGENEALVEQFFSGLPILWRSTLVESLEKMNA